MNKSPKGLSKNKNKKSIKNEDLKNISGGRVRFPESPAEPDEIRRILDERR
ncbi:hypothetical protein [Legionella jordanis]|uniref:Uncharacterized protein n=1 Tax=Legionella jordanis TaxID=456 RepID=A0A0W0V8G4_9GAMM|nr:hypothetical protein [Legionella jordanis]KTD16378.1 hypothetical protein Ljor_0684 [Legionella jordanis]VEH12162.1 Uncharacterised protein [Legionella jordanis]